ncbi:hypothetical protein GCM10007385_05070 [Tateyamaria omphalii]|uniref:hypothetical protein n=1 Tax=Tateyamaria omphalii TaxID=299262 RepID=UPI00199BFE31|nr:hypothetical protein [Tateyamaria omphalii]GGX40646.1 hypothetical protein GCM10007385_05070 [Tateyamaria omphalii]
MTHNRPKPWGRTDNWVSRGIVLSTVTQIKLHEAVQVNHDRLDALYGEMDPTNAEDVVCRAMEELALRLAHCDRLYRKGELDDLRRAAKSMIAIADQIGMDVLAHVASDVVRCAKARDQVALAATLGRLMRTGEGSLSAIWDLQNITL